MNVNNINELLERYYDALTTESEELELKRFFANEEVPTHLQAEKEMFLQMQAMADTHVSTAAPSQPAGNDATSAATATAAPGKRLRRFRRSQRIWVAGL